MFPRIQHAGGQRPVFLRCPTKLWKTGGRIQGRLNQKLEECADLLITSQILQKQMWISLNIPVSKTEVTQIALLREIPTLRSDLEEGRSYDTSSNAKAGTCSGMCSDVPSVS